jgi:uncharacterized membrane protein YjgN (DUF898 family)
MMFLCILNTVMTLGILIGVWAGVRRNRVR